MLFSCHRYGIFRQASPTSTRKRQSASSPHGRTPECARAPRPASARPRAQSPYSPLGGRNRVAGFDVSDNLPWCTAMPGGGCRLGLPRRQQEPSFCGRPRAGTPSGTASPSRSCSEIAMHGRLPPCKCPTAAFHGAWPASLGRQSVRRLRLSRCLESPVGEGKNGGVAFGSRGGWGVAADEGI